MKKVDDLVRYLNIDDHCFSANSNYISAVTTLDIFDPEYDELHASELEKISSFISSFKNLEYLTINVSDFEILNLDFLNDLSYLISIEIESLTNLDNLKFLQHKGLLRTLSLESSNISSIEELKSLKYLKSIHIGSGKIEDLSPLEELKNIESISFPFNNISDISCLSKFENLKYLNLGNNEVYDLLALSELQNLEFLYLNSNKIKNIEPLKKNRNLKQLQCSNNQLIAISILKEFTELKDLDISKNDISDISVIKNLKELSSVNISNNRTEFLQAISALPSLTTLYADENNFKDLSEINIQSKLYYLSMKSCQINDVTFLQNQQMISYLNLNDNHISDFSALQKLDRLSELHLKNNNFKDHFPIQYFSQLQLIDLSGNQFGNAQFSLYITKIFQPEKKTQKETLLLKDLQKMNADYYYRKGLDDEALAFYYYDTNEKEPEEFYIYVQKLLNMPSVETVYIKYYFSKITNSIYRNKNFKELTDENYQRIYDKIQTIKNPEKTKLTDILMKIRNGENAYFHFSYADFYFYEKVVKNPLIEDELLFLKGNLQVNRENLMANLYFLRLLHERNSPFYFNLFHKIKKVLKMNFAYTEEERKKHDDYNYLLHNLYAEEILPKEGNFKNYSLDPSYQYTHYQFPDLKSTKSNAISVFFSKLFLWVVIIFTVISFIMVVVSFFQVIKSFRNL